MKVKHGLIIKSASFFFFKSGPYSKCLSVQVCGLIIAYHLLPSKKSIHEKGLILLNALKFALVNKSYIKPNKGPAHLCVNFDRGMRERKLRRDPACHWLWLKFRKVLPTRAFVG